jgi:hypothetical protein
VQPHDATPRVRAKTPYIGPQIIVIDQVTLRSQTPCDPEDQIQAVKAKKKERKAEQETEAKIDQEQQLEEVEPPDSPEESEEVVVVEKEYWVD